jgi:mRNA interferase HigB
LEKQDRSSSGNILRIIARKTLVEFWAKHSDAEEPLKAWFHEARQAEWSSPDELKQRYPSASIVNRNRVVFNIKGNNCRLIAAINYHHKLLYIRFIGTHAEYGEVDASTI